MTTRKLQKEGLVHLGSWLLESQILRPHDNRQAGVACQQEQKVRDHRSSTHRTQKRSGTRLWALNAPSPLRGILHPTRLHLLRVPRLLQTSPLTGNCMRGTLLTQSIADSCSGRKALCSLRQPSASGLSTVLCFEASACEKGDFGN